MNKNQQGSIMMLFCILLPVIIVIIGICIDVGVILYESSRLSSAVKFATISASTIINEDNEIQADWEFVDECLKANHTGATIIKYEIGSDKKSSCTVEAKAIIPHYFMRIFGYENKQLTESYTVERGR